MKLFLLTAGCQLLLTTFALSQTDNPKCSDKTYNVFTKMEGFYIADCQEFEFKTIDIWVERNSRKLTKEGKYTKIYYKLAPESNRKIVGKQIVNNYVSAVKKVNGQVIKDSDDMGYQLSRNGKTIWVSLSVSPYAGERNEYYIEMVEETEMKLEIETNLQQTLADKGKAIFYGIYFDVGKAIVKPESHEAIKSIADYLIANPKSSIFIVGHTDNTGDYLKNVKLSKDRAAAVKAYLIAKFKADGKLLFAEGVGPLSPVAANSSEEGKKLNRRVEVVVK